MSDTKSYILVVEDSVPNRNILVHLLKKIGLSVKEAENGEAAFAVLEESVRNGEKPELIFSDVMMPKMSGLELLQRVRADGRFENVRFVLITAVAEREYILQAKQWNVNGYILKPVSYDKIIKKLTEFFPDRNFPKAAS